MFKRIKSKCFFFEGKKLYKLDECSSYCELMPEEEKALEKLQQYLKNNSLTVLCTFNGWDNFLNRTILTGNVNSFINYIKDFVKNFPSEMYHLTDSGDLRVATINSVNRKGRLY